MAAVLTLNGIALVYVKVHSIDKSFTEIRGQVTYGT